MNRDSLQIRAALASQDHIKKQIIELQNRTKEVDETLKAARLNQFFDYYNVPADVIMTNYVKRLGECCYQGGDGYRLWLNHPGLPTYCHCIVNPNKYNLSQPNQKESDAYWAIYGKDMEITKEKHMERWGN